MAAGKQYLNQSALHGIPSAILIYHDLELSQLSVNAADVPLPNRVMRLEVFHDGGGHYIISPVDPASVTGLPELLA